MPNPPSVIVVGRFGLVVGDGVDEGDEPDTTWCDSGVIRIVPLSTVVKVIDATPVPVELGVVNIDTPIDPEGYQTRNGARYVKVTDLTSESVNPRILSGRATHKIQFRNLKAGTNDVVFVDRDVRLAADTAQPLDAIRAAAFGLPTGTMACILPNLLPVPVANSVPVVRGADGTGIANLTQPTPTTMALALTTGETTDEIILPVGPGGSDAGVAGYLDDPDSLTTAKVTANIAQYVEPRGPLNILDFGVLPDVATDQSAAINAALAANPDRLFYFPPGAYRLDSAMVINSRNYVSLARDARLYAGAAMDTLVVYSDTGVGYCEDRSFVGGILDGKLLANKLMTIVGVLHLTLAHTVFQDGIHRGLVTTAGNGAEIVAYNLRFHNTGITNVVDNIAIEANMGDSHFRDILIRDWTVGVRDNGANRWERVHPWIGPDIGAVTQMTTRYPSSVGFDLVGQSDLAGCLSDTFRIGFKASTNGTAYTAPPRLLNCRATWAEGTLPDALATANPAYAIDNTDGVGIVSDRLTVKGHTVVPGNLLTGPSTNLLMRNTVSYGYIKGAQGTTADSLDYGGPGPIYGIQQGERTFTPTLIGTADTGGGHGTGYTHTYATQTGRMQVTGNRVDYFINIVATLTASTNFAGSLRVGGMTLASGATSIRDGIGVAGGNGAGVISTFCVIPAGSSVAITPRVLASGSGNDVDIPALRGTQVRILAHITTTVLKAS